MSCRRCCQNQPWSSCPRTSQLCGNKKKGRLVNGRSALNRSAKTLSLPNKSCSWSVDEMPSVGSEVFPSNIFGVVPESAHLKRWVIKLASKKYIRFVGERCKDSKIPYLSCSIPRVPKGIPEVLSWAGGGVDNFNGQPRVTLGLSRFIWPVGLRDLLPHHDVKPGAGLVAEHKASVVIVPLCVDEERSAEVYRVELVVAWRRRLEVSTLSFEIIHFQIVACPIVLTNSNAGVTVDSLDELFTLMADYPVGVNLWGALGVQRHHLELAEVCLADVKVLGTNVIDIRHVVLVKVILASISTAITWKEYTHTHTS